jgi:tRNA pseudouridine13 synthase
VLTLMGQALDSESAAQPRLGGRFKRGMLFSAARSYLFNQLLSARLQQGNWNRYVEGDVLNLDGTNRYFVIAEGQWDESLQQRLQDFDIHLSGPLVGNPEAKDKYLSQRQAADIEDAVCKQFSTLVEGLKHFGLTAARRPLRFRPIKLSWQWRHATELELKFALPRGCYATSLLRELCVIND